MTHAPVANPPRRVALVTGAGVRVGAAIALALARAGYDLVLHANRSRDAAKALANAATAAARALDRNVAIRTAVITADLSHPDAIAPFAEAVLSSDPCRASNGALDLVVHNAGLYDATPFHEVTRDTFARTMAVNFESPFFLTQALLPALQKSPAPAIICIGDIAGERPEKGYAHYCISKAALLMMTRALALELAPHVRVNAVSPGTVAFPENFTPEARDAILARIPLAREGEPDDIARTVVFLASNAPYVTGQTIAVDGGRNTRI